MTTKSAKSETEAEKKPAPKTEEAKPAARPKKEKPKVAKDDPFLQALSRRPLGVDGRTLAFEVGETSVGKVFGRLNTLVEAGLARKVGGVYQPTPEGAMHAAGQAILPSPSKKSPPAKKAEAPKKK